MPMNDYKYEIQILAEELAEVKFNKDFYDLTDEQQSEVYEQAIKVYHDQK